MGLINLIFSFSSLLSYTLVGFDKTISFDCHLFSLLVVVYEFLFGGMVPVKTHGLGLKIWENLRGFIVLLSLPA